MFKMSFFPDSQPYVQTGAQPYVQTGAQPDVQTGAQPDVRTGAQPDVRTGAQPDVQTGAQPDVQTGAQPDVQTEDGFIILDNPQENQQDVSVRSLILDTMPICSRSNSVTDSELTVSSESDYPSSVQDILFLSESATSLLNMDIERLGIPPELRTLHNTKVRDDIRNKLLAVRQVDNTVPTVGSSYLRPVDLRNCNMKSFVIRLMEQHGIYLKFIRDGERNNGRKYLFYIKTNSVDLYDTLTEYEEILEVSLDRHRINSMYELALTRKDKSIVDIKCPVCYSEVNRENLLPIVIFNRCYHYSCLTCYIKLVETNPTVPMCKVWCPICRGHTTVTYSATSCQQILSRLF